jgi:hypothetical protein
MSLSISADDPSQQESVDLNEGDDVKDLTTDASGSDDDEPIASNAVPVYPVTTFVKVLAVFLGFHVYWKNTSPSPHAAR